MNPNVNPYSSDANMFVGAPQGEASTDAAIGGTTAAVDAAPAQEENLFGGMNVFGDDPSPVGGSGNDNPFAQPPAAEPSGLDVQQEEETIQFYTPEGVSGQKTNLEYTPPPIGADDTAATEPPPPPPQEQMDTEDPTARPVERTAKCWTLDFYRQYFDVDTEEVTGRIVEVATFKMPKFMIAECEGGEQADMYGPVWIATTLWVALAVFGEIGEEMVKTESSDGPAPVPTTQNQTTMPTPAPTSTSSSSSFSFDFYWYVIIGMSVTYAYVFLAPLLLWTILKLNSTKSDLTKTISLYGYAIVPLIPGALITIIPSTVAKLVAIFLSSAFSLAIIGFNLQKLGAGLDNNWKIAYFSAIILCHCLMTMLLFYEILFG